MHLYNKELVHKVKAGSFKFQLSWNLACQSAEHSKSHRQVLSCRREVVFIQQLVMNNLVTLATDYTTEFVNVFKICMITICLW